jgi:hypothetical protein
MTEQQQRIIDSLVNEFDRMNQPTTPINGGLVDWSKINQDKNEWERTKREIELSNDAIRKLIQQTVDDANVKIRESLGHVFEIKSRYFTEVENGYRWDFYNSKGAEAFSVTLDVVKSNQYSECRNFYVQVLKSIRFHTYAGNEHGALIADTIEELFQHERVTKTIMKYI